MVFAQNPAKLNRSKKAVDLLKEFSSNPIQVVKKNLFVFTNSSSDLFVDRESLSSNLP